MLLLLDFNTRTMKWYILFNLQSCSNGLKKIRRKLNWQKQKNSWLKDINELSNPIIVIAECK